MVLFVLLHGHTLLCAKHCPTLLRAKRCPTLLCIKRCPTLLCIKRCPPLVGFREQVLRAVHAGREGQAVQRHRVRGERGRPQSACGGEAHCAEQVLSVTVPRGSRYCFTCFLYSARQALVSCLRFALYKCFIIIIIIIIIGRIYCVNFIRVCYAWTV